VGDFRLGSLVPSSLEEPRGQESLELSQESQGLPEPQLQGLLLAQPEQQTEQPDPLWQEPARRRSGYPESEAQELGYQESVQPALGLKRKAGVLQKMRAEVWE
jgi:hypothetical protein